MQTVALVHAVQLILQAKVKEENKIKFMKKKIILEIWKKIKIKLIMPVHVPALFHAVDLQIQVKDGSL